jgi:hypothetical protein
MAEVEKTPETATTPEGEQEVPATLDERLTAFETVMMEIIDKVEALTKKVETVQKTAVTKPKGLFGGKRTPVPTKDLKTGVVYPSKAAVGKAFAAEAGADPLESTAYYVVIAKLKMPDGKDRFVDASTEEGAAAIAKRDAERAAEVEESNKKLAAEEAAKAKVTPPAVPSVAAVAPKQQQGKAKK